jgi:hypothetical protein
MSYPKIGRDNYIATENEDSVEQEEAKKSMEFIDRLKSRPFVNPQMMRQDPYDVLKFLVESNMMHFDISPKFVSWEAKYLSENMEK